MSQTTVSSFRVKGHKTFQTSSEGNGYYLVELLELPYELQQYFMHGDTYQEAVANAQEVLELLVEDYQA
jgi:antitoxin HicB